SRRHAKLSTSRLAHPRRRSCGCRNARQHIRLLSSPVDLSRRPRRPPMNLIQLALRRPYTFIVMAMLIVLATPFALLKMPTDILPEINIPVVSIIWSYTGMSAQEMGQRITATNERSLTTTVSDIEHIESQTLPGIAIIKV